MTSLDQNVRRFQYLSIFQYVLTPERDVRRVFNQCMKPSCDSLGKIAWVRVKSQMSLSGEQEILVNHDFFLMNTFVFKIIIEKIIVVLYITKSFEA